IAVRVQIDQAFTAEPADSLPQRRDAHSHLVGEFGLLQPRAGGQGTGEDEAAQLEIRDVTLGGADGRDLRRCHGASLPACAGGHTEPNITTNISYLINYEREEIED